ncbi:MAG: hypothetical protein M3Y73_09060 [Actinomycetota bacterium]|nr:hypothetical protein [Actinomycetota bacterium]
MAGSVRARRVVVRRVVGLRGSLEVQDSRLLRERRVGPGEESPGRRELPVARLRGGWAAQVAHLGPSPVVA